MMFPQIPQMPHIPQTPIYFYCVTCSPDESKAPYGLCSPTLKRPCLVEHAAGLPTTHRMQYKAVPERVMTRESPRRKTAPKTAPKRPTHGGSPRRARPDPPPPLSSQGWPCEVPRGPLSNPALRVATRVLRTASLK